MAPKRNSAIPNGHFHKDWQSRIKTWFNQPAKKYRRKQLRIKKAHLTAPRPQNSLRPIVKCPTARYNTKIRTGRGFSVRELKTAGLNAQYAKSVGIAVDYRRRNVSMESVMRNLQRLIQYSGKLIVWSDRKKAQRESKGAVKFEGDLRPIVQSGLKCKARMVSDEERMFDARNHLRQLRAEQHFVGRRLKKMKLALDSNDYIMQSTRETKRRKK